MLEYDIKFIYCKTFGLVFIQLNNSFDFSSLDQRCSRNTNAMILYIVSYVVFIVTYFAIACCERVRKRSPGNIIAITIFTLSLSLLVSTICLFHDVTWVLMAMGITAALCLGLTLFSFQTKIDFTGKVWLHSSRPSKV